MELKKARFYAWLSFGGALCSLVVTFLFSMTLFYQSHRGDNGRGVYVLPQFFSPRLSSSRELISASSFEKGDLELDYHRDLVTEMLARYYLEMRYTFFPDVDAMVKRWGWKSPLLLFSTDEVHRNLMNFGSQNKKAYLSDADLQKKITQMTDVRTVEIKQIKKEENANRFNIKMNIYVLDGEGNFKGVEKYDVIMVFRYAKSRKFYSRNLSNPYGLYFISVNAELVKE